MRIVFLGTGDIGLPSLEALIQSKEHELLAVVTQPDKPVGRKQVLTPPQIKVCALEAGLPVLQPQKLRKEAEILAAYPADVFVVVAYGQILPQTVLDMPGKGCLNIHASLLPKYRGASPIQAAIREGDAESGITIMWMDAGLDTGDILLQHRLPLAVDETGGSLHDKLAAMAPAALSEALQMIAANAAPKIKQDEALVSHTRKLERNHGKLNWSASASELERLVRAYCPWPGTFAQVQSGNDSPVQQLKVHSAAVIADAHSCPVPGTVLATEPGLLVACGEGVLELKEVQLEGRKRMPAGDFVRGFGLQAGDRML